ncbi:hypothetical protein [Chryseobacterium sp. Leaf394]|uniref:hypothetical protein n=1 Tax=Chryseobacterium sp. Leaf394 TaxID=1736361 RepID=UPI0006F73E68|nr:hypothetical protein [Chryseobacterium sp. Leaf394]KQS93202.1 hypothetical protein ASG21_12485 [Chryseobacterium sp. Leaf394]
MIYIIDRFVEKHLHVLANVNFIRLLEISYPQEQKKIFLESEHLLLVRKYFSANEKNLEFVPQNFGKFAGSKLGQVYRVINRLFSDLFFFWKLFLNADSKKDWFFIAHIYPLSLIIFNLLKLIFPKMKIVLAIHGEVEYIFNSKNLYQKFIGNLYKYSFRIPVKNTQYLFLTKVSEKIILEAGLLQKNQIISIELPTYGKNHVVEKKYQVNKSVMRVGHIGSAGVRKNTQCLFSLAEKLASEIENNSIKVELIGTIEDNLASHLNTYVIDYVNSQLNVPLDRNIFDQNVQSLDYVLFFYDKDDFILRSSAAFFDAINFEIPIIALKTSFFSNIFSSYGSLGYLCDDIDEMKEKIIYLQKHQGSRELEEIYCLFKASIKEFKQAISIENVAKDFKLQLT